VVSCLLYREAPGLPAHEMATTFVQAVTGGAAPAAPAAAPARPTP
jgi:hypothetical protein